MKFVCDNRDLVSVMNIVMKAVSGRATMPILECVLIDAEDGIIKLTSNNLELAISSVLQGTVKKPGRICVDAKLLNEIARKVPAGDVVLDADESTFNVTIKCGKSKFNIPGKSAEDFISLPNLSDSDVSFSISQPVFGGLVQKTAFCAAKNDKNVMMTGECVVIENDKMKFVALDGHRVAIKELQLDRSFGEWKAIIPVNSISEVSKLLSKNMEDKINFSLNGRHAIFQFDNTIITIRLIEGDYFNYERIFGSDPCTIVNVYAPEFLQCLSRMSVLVREGDKKPIICEIEGDIMHVSVNSNLGYTEEDIEIKKTGKDLKIGFNPRFLAESVSAIDDDEIEIRFINSVSPVILTKDGEDYTYVVLPVNI